MQLRWRLRGWPHDHSTASRQLQEQPLGGGADTVTITAGAASTWSTSAGDLAISGFANLNLLLFYGISGQGPGDSRVIGIDVTVPLAVLAVAFYVWMWRLLRHQEGDYSSIRQ